VDLVRSVQDPVAASKQLVDHALSRFSTDNLSCMIVRFNKSALMDAYNNKLDAIGVEGDPSSVPGKMSEVDKILGDAKRKVQEDGVPGVGVSGSNSGKGHDPVAHDEDVFKRVSMEKVVEEEPGLVEGDSPDITPDGAESISPETRSTLTKGIPEGSSSR
jgi:protein phosphatase PTC1